MSTEDARALYDDLWTTKWSAMQTFGPVHRHMRRALLDEVRSLGPTSILDVGCGAGDNLAALDGAGDFELSGLDISHAALARASARVPHASLVSLDITRDHLPQSFDLVYSIQMIEHILDDFSALRNIARMSHRYVYLSTMTGRMRRSELAIGHVRNYSPTELQAKAEAAGIRVRKVAKWGFPFYSAFRAAVELTGGRVADAGSPIGRLASTALYQLYRLNSSRRGDVLTLLGEV
ncbi:MAG TPA: class I SAM-dependent methyltransferase [Acidimicrobiales bacterium]|nr:class I SAM-dependent methyltransferase [Acidimicrobiales bacterium]